VLTTLLGIVFSLFCLFGAGLVVVLALKLRLFDNVVVDAIKLILLSYSNFNIAKLVVNKIERVK